MTKHITTVNFDKPDNYNITSSKAIFQDGTAITHKDYYYKNEISVICGGKTYTYDTPNASAVFFIWLDIVLAILLITQFILHRMDINFLSNLILKRWYYK